MNYYYYIAGMLSIPTMIYLMVRGNWNTVRHVRTVPTGATYWALASIVGKIPLIVLKWTACIYLIRLHIVNAEHPSNLRIGIVLVLVFFIHNLFTSSE